MTHAPLALPVGAAAPETREVRTPWIAIPLQSTTRGRAGSVTRGVSHLMP